MPQVAQFYNGSETTQYNVLQATDTIHSSDKLTLLGSAGLSTATGNTGLSELASVGGDVAPDAARRVQRIVRARRRGGDAGAAADSQRSGLAALRLQRQGGVRQRARPTADEQLVELRARRATRITFHGGNISLTLYRQLQNGVLLPVYVNGTMLNQLGEIPPSYFQQIAAIYNSPAGCNAPPGTPFLPQQLYFTTPVSGVQRALSRRRADRLRDVRQSRGSAVLQPHRRAGRLEQLPLRQPVLDHDSRPAAAQRAAAEGGPGARLQGAALDLRVARRRAAREREQSEQSAGVHHVRCGRYAQLTRGTLTFAATNITNTYGDVFASPANAVPFTTAGGYVLPNIARPLQPRTYSVTYSARFGQGVRRRRPRRRFVRAAAADSSARERAAAEGPGGPGGRRPGRPGGPGGGGGGRGFASLFSPLPQTPPADPFVVGANPATCSAENAPKARPTRGRAESVRRADRSEAHGGGLSRDDGVAGVSRCDGDLSRHGHDLRARDHAEGQRACCARSPDASRCTSRAATT